jgi:hypothetical protein
MRFESLLTINIFTVSLNRLMARRRIASYYKNKGFMMSRRGRLAITKNEHPLQYWMERFVMDKLQIEKLLIYMGNHHTGIRGNLTPFYRLPNKNDPEELMKIFKEFHQVKAKKLNFIRIMSEHLQKKIEEKGEKIPASEQPRTKRKRRKWRRILLIN